MQINGVRSVLETNKQIHKYNTLEYTGTFHGYQWRSSNTSCVSSYREAHLDDKEIFGFVLSMSGYRRSSSGSTISSTCGFGFQSYVLFVFTQIQQTCKIQHSNKYRYDKWWWYVGCSWLSVQKSWLRVDDSQIWDLLTDKHRHPSTETWRQFYCLGTPSLSRCSCLDRYVLLCSGHW